VELVREPAEGGLALELRPLVTDTRGVARLLGLSERTVRALNSSGRLPRALALGRRRVWRVREIEAWLEAGAPERSRWEELRGRRA
jgi:predicted DNA-binding transcriptional regulator AlpA